MERNRTVAAIVLGVRIWVSLLIGTPILTAAAEKDASARGDAVKWHIRLCGTKA